MKRALLVFFILLLAVNILVSQERFRKSPPSPEPLQELRFPSIETVQLANGLSLSVVFQEEMPIMSLQLVIFAGESHSPSKLPGMATFAAEMLSRGTSNISSSEVRQQIESVGGTFSVVTYLDYSLWTFSFLDEYLDQALELFSQMVLYPAFLAREIDAIKRTLFYDLLEKETDPDFVARRHLLRLLFKNHPYENSTFSGSIIKNISQKDLLDFYDRYYRPNNSHLVLVGNLNLKTASRKVSHYLNTWKAKELANPALPQLRPNEKERICFIDVPGSKDCTLYLGNTIFPASYPESFALLVLNQVLGGTPNSRLFMNLRESKGYAYFAFSGLEFYKLSGVFLARAKVTPEVVYLSVQEIFKELKVITREPVSFFEIEQAKSYLIGNFPLQIESWNEFSSKISEIKALNLGEEYWKNYYKNIMLVNTENVFEVAQECPLLTPVIVIAGDKEVMIDHLKEFDAVEFYNNKGIFQYTIRK